MARILLRNTLNDIPDFSLKSISSLNKIIKNDPTGYEAFVLYFHHKKLSDQALKSLDDYVSQGGGLLALHSVSASFKGNNKFYEILGGRFREHGPIEEFHIYPEISPDTLFGTRTPFTVKDELYLHELNSEVTIHFFTVVDGKTEPVVWTKRHGEGRVCYVSLGHTTQSMKHPAVKQIIQAGLLWAAGVSQNYKMADE
jgi:type 1 glutamine amidotransferase